MAQAYYQRIDFILTACDQAQTNGDGLKWFNALACFYKEIYPKLKEQEKKETFEMYQELVSLKNKAIKRGGTIPTQKFMNFELYLRQRMEDRNMLTPKSEDLSGL